MYLFVVEAHILHLNAEIAELLAKNLSLRHVSDMQNEEWWQRFREMDARLFMQQNAKTSVQKLVEETERNIREDLGVTIHYLENEIRKLQEDKELMLLRQMRIVKEYQQVLLSSSIVFRHMLQFTKLYLSFESATWRYARKRQYVGRGGGRCW